MLETEIMITFVTDIITGYKERRKRYGNAYKRNPNLVWRRCSQI